MVRLVHCCRARTIKTRLRWHLRPSSPLSHESSFTRSQSIGEPSTPFLVDQQNEPLLNTPGQWRRVVELRCQLTKYHRPRCRSKLEWALLRRRHDPIIPPHLQHDESDRYDETDEQRETHRLTRQPLPITGSRRPALSTPSPLVTPISSPNHCVARTAAPFDSCQTIAFTTPSASRANQHAHPRP